VRLIPGFSAQIGGSGCLFVALCKNSVHPPTSGFLGQ
jgi:hypothetical protein